MDKMINLSELCARKCAEYIENKVITCKKINISQDCLDLIKKYRYKYWLHPTAKIVKEQFKIMIKMFDIYDMLSFTIYVNEGDGYQLYRKKKIINKWRNKWNKYEKYYDFFHTFWTTIMDKYINDEDMWWIDAMIMDEEWYSDMDSGESE